LLQAIWPIGFATRGKNLDELVPILSNCPDFAAVPCKQYYEMQATWASLVQYATQNSPT